AADRAVVAQQPLYGSGSAGRAGPGRLWDGRLPLLSAALPTSRRLGAHRGGGNMREPIYLDHNASTPVLPEVVDAMLPYLREHFGNPSSGHVFGQRARAAVESARSEVAALLACDASEVVFT